MLQLYECKLRDKQNNRASMIFKADSFAHAEEQCLNAIKDYSSGNFIIIVISLSFTEKSYENKERP